MITLLIILAEKGLLPDAIIRLGIKRLCAQRLAEATSSNEAEMEKEHAAWIDVLKVSPIALVPEKANEQHYEVPPRLFELVLGNKLKYSSGFWPEGVSTLDQSEAAMLKLTTERAGLVDGQAILELGCGWGSLTLYMAEHFPKSKITAVSNSNDQRQFIEARCDELNLKNVEIITADMNDFETTKLFDRVVSIEMFEHMRNYEKLLGRVSAWLKNDGTYGFSTKNVIKTNFTSIDTIPVFHLQWQDSIPNRPLQEQQLKRWLQMRLELDTLQVWSN